jgi:hypothetical protein
MSVEPMGEKTQKLTGLQQMSIAYSLNSIFFLTILLGFSLDAGLFKRYLDSN